MTLLAGRYELRRTLGSGASGVVHAGWDTQLGEEVAIKALHRVGPTDIWLLKHEFRALGGYVHPNLVTLHELGNDEGNWFFTMELVEGAHLLDACWGYPQEREAKRVPALGDAQLERIVQAFGDVAVGVSALHALGLLHRDLKPSNVLVRSADGRAKVADFGLAVEPGTIERQVCGTVAYMSPEQSRGGPVEEDSDWYALGAMLFEALTGQLPFEGSFLDMIAARQNRAPPAVRTLASHAPTVLAQLADGLLAKSAADRPMAAEVARVLGVALVPSPPPVGLLGRSAELAALLPSVGTVVEVTGPSGIGKTTLVEAALRALPRRPTVVSVRCYERESTAYKVIDPLIESLGRLTERAPGGADGLAAQVPYGTAIAQMFPGVLRYGWADAWEPLGRGEPERVRRDAVAGLRAWIRALAEHHPIVLWVDDFQWADLDSARLLSAITAGAPLALVCSLREGAAADALLSVLDLPRARVAVGPLDDVTGLALARRGAPGLSDALLSQVVAEAQGSPFFLGDLARVASERGAVRLTDAVAWRLATLPEEARVVLGVVALAGRPIAASWALAASRRLSSEVGQRALQVLEAARLVTGVSGLVACVHDRVREGVAELVPPALGPRVHLALAETLEAAGAEPEWLSDHFLGAGRTADALRTAAAAVERLTDQFAWDLAARLSDRCASLDPGQATRWKLTATAHLARAGRGAEAAARLEGLIPVLTGPDADAARREAANQYLRTGSFARAFELLPEVAASAGGWPGSAARAFGELVWNSVKLRFLPAGRAGPAETAGAVDLAQELAMSLAYADLARAGAFATRANVVARRLGDRRRLAICAAMQGSNLALFGDLATSARRLGEVETALAEQPDPLVDAQFRLHRGIARLCEGRVAESVADLEAADRGFAQLGDRPYEVGMGRNFLVGAMILGGQFEAARARRALYLEEAASRGDAHAERMFRVGYAFQPELVLGDEAGAARNLERARACWTEPSKTVHWVFLQCAVAELETWRGERGPALDRLRAVRRDAPRGLLWVRLTAAQLACRVLPVAADPSDADGAARALRWAADPISRTTRQMALATAATMRGDQAAAVAAWDATRGAYDATGMRGWQAIAARGAARAAGDRAAAARAEEQLAGLGVADPGRFARTYGPEVPWECGR